MFREHPDLAHQNRTNAANFHTTTAELADGTIGIVAFFGGFFAVLTDEEALHAAHDIINRIESR